MKGNRIVAAGALLVGFLLLTLVPVLTGFDHFPNKSIDMDKSHVPVVRSFAEQFPAIDLSDYNSATTPGMHIVLAVVSKVFGESETLLQVMTCLFGAAMVMVAWWFAAVRLRPWLAVVAVAPLALNPYVLGNSIWVMTDNFSLGLIAFVIGSSVFLAPEPRRLVATSLAMVASVLVRQINLWTMAGAVLAAIAGAPGLRGRMPWHDELDDGWTPARFLVISVGAIATVATLGYFVWKWGGLVPPTYATYHAGGINTGVAPYCLALFGVYALPILFTHHRELLRRPGVRRNAVLGCLVGLAIGLVLPSAAGVDVGRFGGWLWTLAGALPDVGDRSLLLVAGAVLGGGIAGMILGIIFESGNGRGGVLLAFFAVSFLAAYTANSQAFQRYFDPPVLLAIGWGFALMHRERSNMDRRILLAGLGCAAMQFVFAGWTLYRPLLAAASAN